MHATRLQAIFFTLNISKTKWGTRFIPIEVVRKIIYAKSNGHMTDGVMQPYQTLVVSDADHYFYTCNTRIQNENPQ